MVASFEGLILTIDSFGSVARRRDARDFSAVTYDERVITDGSRFYYQHRDGEAIELWAEPIGAPYTIRNWGDMLDHLPLGESRAVARAIAQVAPHHYAKYEAMRERYLNKYLTAFDHILCSDSLLDHGVVHLTAQDVEDLTGFELGISSVTMPAGGRPSLATLWLKGYNFGALRALKNVLKGAVND